MLIHCLAVGQLLKPDVTIADDLIVYGTNGAGHLNKLGLVYFFNFHVVIVLGYECIELLVVYLIA